MNQWKNEKKAEPWKKINEKMFILFNLLLTEVKITVSKIELYNFSPLNIRSLTVANYWLQEYEILALL